MRSCLGTSGGAAECGEIREARGGAENAEKAGRCRLFSHLISGFGPRRGEEECLVRVQWVRRFLRRGNWLMGASTSRSAGNRGLLMARAQTSASSQSSAIREGERSRRRVCVAHHSLVRKPAEIDGSSGAGQTTALLRNLRRGEPAGSPTGREPGRPAIPLGRG